MLFEKKWLVHEFQRWLHNNCLSWDKAVHEKKEITKKKLKLTSHSNEILSLWARDLCK